MNVQEGLKEIAAGNLSQLYFLTGEEPYFIRQAEKAILKAVLGENEDTNLTVFHGGADLRELIMAVETVPFLGDRNLIIVKETTLFKNTSKANAEDETAPEKTTSASNSASEKLITLFGDMPPYSYLVFTSSEKADKRRKIYKALEKQGLVLEANPLRGRELREWLWEKIAELKLKLSPEAKEHLLFVVNMMPQTSLDFLNNELEKIALYTQSDTANAALTLPQLKEILAAVPEISIFAMIEALRQKELALALSLLRQQLKTGKHPVQILALLAKQVEQLLKTQEFLSQGYDHKKIAAHFKLPLFIGEKLVRQSRNFSAAALSRAVVNLAEADYFLKSGRSGVYVLEKIMIELCSDR